MSSSTQKRSLLPRNKRQPFDEVFTPACRVYLRDASTLHASEMACTCTLPARSHTWGFCSQRCPFGCPDTRLRRRARRLRARGECASLATGGMATFCGVHQWINSCGRGASQTICHVNLCQVSMAGFRAAKKLWTGNVTDAEQDQAGKCATNHQSTSIG